MLWREPASPRPRLRLDFALRSPDKRIIVALIDGEIVGATVCDIRTLTPVTMDMVLVVTEIQVRLAIRRRDVASTLLSAAASYGEERDCEIVIASIPAARARTQPLPRQDRVQPDRRAPRHPGQQAALAPHSAGRPLPRHRQAHRRPPHDAASPGETAPSAARLTELSDAGSLESAEVDRLLLIDGHSAGLPRVLRPSGRELLDHDRAAHQRRLRLHVDAHQRAARRAADARRRRVRRLPPDVPLRGVRRVQGQPQSRRPQEFTGAGLARSRRSSTALRRPRRSRRTASRPTTSSPR